MEAVDDEFERAMRGLIERKGKSADSDWEVFNSRINIIREAIQSHVPVRDIWRMLRVHAGFQGARDKLSRFLAEAGLRPMAVRKPV